VRGGPPCLSSLSPRVSVQMEAVVEMIRKACQDADVDETSLLNFVVSDGRMLVATR
jgi:hypothetical protein